MKSALDQFFEMIKALSLEARAQFAIYPSGVHIPDELALAYSYQYEVVGREIAEKYGEDVQRLYRLIYDKFEDTSGVDRKIIFSEDGMCTRPEWETIRGYAGKLLKLLGLESISLDPRRL